MNCDPRRVCRECGVDTDETDYCEVHEPGAELSTVELHEIANTLDFHKLPRHAVRVVAAAREIDRLRVEAWDYKRRIRELEGGWVRAADRLPEPGRTVLAYPVPSARGPYGVAEYRSGPNGGYWQLETGRIYSTDSITHWRAIAPPEEDR